MEDIDNTRTYEAPSAPSTAEAVARVQAIVAELEAEHGERWWSTDEARREEAAREEAAADTSRS